MSKGTTINAAQYVDSLLKLHTNVKNCWKEKLSDNARLPYSGTDTVDVDDTEIQSSYRFSYI